MSGLPLKNSGGRIYARYRTAPISHFIGPALMIAEYLHVVLSGKPVFQH
jgi:hypothetical protein